MGSFFPLTSPQLSIWYTERMYSGTSVSNVAGTLRIKDNVDFELLEKAIQLFIKNNEGIRLRFCLDENGNPRQYVSEYVEKKIPFIDFSVYEDPEKAFFEWNSQRTLQPFELLDNDLYSITMVKISDTDGGGYIITHHLISDAWSMSLIGSVVVDYYYKMKNQMADLNAFLPKPSYLSFVENDVAYRNSVRYEKDKLFWESVFHEIPEATVLKTRTTNRITAKAKRKTFLAPAKFINKLKEYCTEHKVGLYPLFLSALAAYINRTCGKTDLVLGSPILNRLNHADKNTFGMFISTIPLRVRLSAEESFQTVSDRVIEVCSSAYRHQRYPFDQILRFVRDRHSIKENLYDIVLSYQNTKFDKSSGMDYFTRWHFNGYQPNSLTIHINDRDDEGTIIFDYDYHEDLYADKEIEFLHRHYLSLLWHALDNPGKSICKLEMLPELEKQKVLHTFNNTVAEYPREKLIHQLFEEQAEKTPNSVAIVFEGRTMTYRELNERANRLAHVLRKKGVGPNDIVGVLVPRSFDLIIGILAILKAGGAFMTIETGFPKDRIRYMLENSKAPVLLTTDKPEEIPTHTIDISDGSVYVHESEENPVHINDSRDLSYVIYTSGTTGTPKGVMIEHRSLHNFVRCMATAFSYDQHSVVLSVASVCFDLFIMEFMPALLSGSKLVLASNEQRNLPHLVSRLIGEHSVTDILFTPSRMRLLLEDESNAASLANVRHIMLGGEKLESQLVKSLRRYTNACLLNAYGPTEATIAATFKWVEDADRINIGKPIDNTRVYILDQYKNPVPINVQGELYIAGECLARGYVNQPELTDELFTESPFDKNEKLYRTGDLARWYPNGEIQYLGRKDKQIKLRGYRIELGEIEKALLKYPDIKDAAVDIRQDGSHGDFIVAFYVGGAEVHPADVKNFISNQLPKYMIPRFIIPIEDIPLNSSGKKDIRQIPIPEAIYGGEMMVLPENGTEEKVVEILCTLLKLDKVSRTANIFDLGADSLTVIQLISILDKEGYPAGIEEVYSYPSVRELSRMLIEKKAEATKRTHRSEVMKVIGSAMPSIRQEHIDSAAICYIPNGFYVPTVEERPMLLGHIRTHLGNIGLYIIPVHENRLFWDKEKLNRLICEATEMAGSSGAKVVSLTGLLPAATIFGRDICDLVNGKTKITTGHATTSAAVLLTLERILSHCGRSLNDEKVAIAGAEGIGLAVVEMLDSLYPKMKKMTIYRTGSSGKHLQGMGRSEIRNRSVVSTTRNTLPDEAYQASVIIGAANIPNIVDIDSLEPGTILIDYSIPRCFSREKAIKRLESRQDILFSDGGALHTDKTMQKEYYIPEQIDLSAFDQIYHHFLSETEITGCILSGLMIAKSNLNPIIGQVSPEDCLVHYKVLKENGFSGPMPQCDDYLIPSEHFSCFIRRFGSMNKSNP